MGSMNTYRSQQLESYSIRLLEFSSLRNEQLSFKIHYKQLDSKPTYIALSYTWGNPDPEACITVENSSLAITKNLKDALIHIKKHFAQKSTMSSTLLWIDAICINQSDKAEKSHQVNMMGQIYNQASKVYVWLGLPESHESDRNAGLAVKKLEYLQKVNLSAQMENRGYRPWWWPRERLSRRKDQLALSNKVYKDLKKIFDPEEADSQAAWNGIVELWQNEWWTRAWVTQEATIEEPWKTQTYAGVKISKPTPKVSFLYGSHTTDWDRLLSGVAIALVLQKMPLLSASTKKFQDSFRNISTMSIIRANRLFHREVDLLGQLQLTRYTGASNARDKVYANLGLMPKSSAALIRPDYHMSVLDTYLEIVQIELEKSVPSLDFLGYAMKVDEPRRTPSPEVSYNDWPSWLPNWDDPLKLFPLPKKLYMPSGRDGSRSIVLWDTPEAADKPIVSGRAYDATRGEGVTAYISGYSLLLKGAIIDTIDERHHTEKVTIAARRERINRWYLQQNKLYPNGEDFNKGLLAAQVVDVKRDYRGNAIARGNQLNLDLINSRHAELTPEEETAQAEMRECLDRAAASRGLCLTERGYIGLVPSPARAGDQICILMGVQVLYVLRPRPGEANVYEYIGECFVYALMDGEALDWVRQGNSSINDFILV